MDGGRRASRIRGVVALAVLSALVAAALVSPVGAALNKNKVKNIATKAVNNLTYTESEADGRFINTGEKASDAETLDGVDSGGFIQPQGITHVSVGPHDWVIGNLNFGGPATVTYFTGEAHYSAGVQTEDQILGVSPALPAALYGKALQLQGVELCYSTPTNTTIDGVFLSVVTNSTAGDSGPTVASATDTTNRTDDACRLYTMSTPFTLGGDHFVTFEASVDYSDSGLFIIGRTTFVLTPTSSSAAPLARQDT